MLAQYPCFSPLLPARRIVHPTFCEVLSAWMAACKSTPSRARVRLSTIKTQGKTLARLCRAFGWRSLGWSRCRWSQRRSRRYVSRQPLVSFERTRQSLSIFRPAMILPCAFSQDEYNGRLKRVRSVWLACNPACALLLLCEIISRKPRHTYFSFLQDLRDPDSGTAPQEVS